MVTQKDFESAITQLTLPLNHQFPRPWMTTLEDPRQAKVFVVGKNQRNGYPQNLAGGHARHLDALFNRNGQSCRALYDEVTGGVPSRTRRNTDRFVQMLLNEGVTQVLETNVICYSSPMSADLRLDKHAGGARRGEEIFRYLLAAISPKVMVVHGSGAAKSLCRVLEISSIPEPKDPSEIHSLLVNGLLVVAIPSLAPPAYNRWHKWADNYLRVISKRVADHCRSH